jgi:ketosteroid isomerase-like protein
MAAAGEDPDNRPPLHGERNVELHRRTVEAFNARDIEALIACCDPSCEYHPLFAASFGDVTVYRGHDGLRRWQRDFEEVWGDEIRVEPQACFDLGEHTLMFYVVAGRGRRSGAEVAMSLTQVARWRDGRLVYNKVYAHREDALSNLNVCEGELEPIAP